MKISHKMICGYLAIVVVMSISGYFSFKIYNDIKGQVIELQRDKLGIIGPSDQLIGALENGQKSIQALIDEGTHIIYTRDAVRKEATRKRTRQQLEKNLQKNLEEIERILSPVIKPAQGTETAEPNGPGPKKSLKNWLDLRKKHFYYHWKYLSHFINLADELPEQAQNFFERTLEPHYIKNIYPLIHSYRESEEKIKEEQVRKIVEEAIPNATSIILWSTIVMLVCVFLLGFLVMRSISSPLHKLTSAALEIGRGQLDTRIDIRSNDEVGLLADAFNRMTADLGRTTVSKTYVDNIIRSMLDMLIVVNPDTTISKINRSTVNLLGYSRNEIIGKPFSEVIIEDDPDHPILDELMRRSSFANVEKLYLTKSGDRIPVLFSGAVMHDESGNVQGMVCAARDISDLKRSESALKKAYGEMEKRVKERTAELVDANRLLQMEIEERRRTEAALRDSENRLRQLSSHILTAQENERKRISMELHDDLGQSLSLLKVQLTSIRRNLMKTETKPHYEIEETLKYLDFIIESVRRLSRDLSPSLLEDLGLTAALKRLVNDFEKHYKFDTTLKIKNVDPLISREKQINVYRIFQEILSNIGKHAKAAHVEIVVKSSDKEIEFTVNDDGRGFDLQRVEAKNPIDKGIGLATIQERALILGSSLAICTEPEKGARITFRIPVHMTKE